MSSKWIDVNGVLINANLVGRVHKLLDKNITFLYADGSNGNFKYNTNEERDSDFEDVRMQLLGYHHD